MKTKVTTTHSCLRFLLIMAQCFGLFPVTGVMQENVTNLKFFWTSKRTLYSVIFTILANVNTVFYGITMFSQDNISLDDWVTLLFFIVAVLTVVMFIDVARKWPRLMKKWTEVDIAMCSYGFPLDLRKKLIIITVITMGAATIEHALFMSAKFCCFGIGVNFAEKLDSYLASRFDFVFSTVPYNIVWGIALEIINIFSTFSWNFMDLFIIMISLCLSARFKQVSKYIQFLAARNVEDENIWSKVREDYTRLVLLCESVDHVMSSIVLVSFTNNLFVILIQFFKTLELPPFDNIWDKTYYIYSFGFLIIRLSAVAIYAATINNECKKPKHYLNNLSSLVYNVEVDRLIYQTKYHTAALTGHRMFRVTRTLILRVAVAIVSYELVLVDLLRMKREHFF